MHGLEEIAGAARRLIDDALGAAGVATPADVSSPSVSPPALPRPGDGERGMTAASPKTTIQGVSLPHAAPVADMTGVRAFVSRIRGLDHLQLPPVRLGGLPAPASPAPLTPAFFDVDAVRRDFPILRERVHGKPLAWFDNAATTQKPQVVTDAIAHFYAHHNSNIHRGAHTLAARATDAYEKSRQTVAGFLGAGSPDEILFVRGCTEGINLVANVLAPGLARGDEIVLTELEIGRAHV